MTAAEAQTEVDRLKNQIDSLTEKALSIKTEIGSKRAEAVSVMLGDQDAAALEDEILRLESRSITVRGGIEAAAKQLGEANGNLEIARQADARQRVAEIAEELGRVAPDLKKNMGKTVRSAQYFQKLLDEATGLHNKFGVSLTALGTWIHLASENGGQITEQLNFIADRFADHGPDKK